MSDLESIKAEIQKHEQAIQNLKMKLADAVLSGGELPRMTRKLGSNMEKAAPKAEKPKKEKRSRRSSEQALKDRAEMHAFIAKNPDTNGTALKEKFGSSYVPDLGYLKEEGLVDIYGDSPRNTTYKVSKKKFPEA